MNQPTRRDFLKLMAGAALTVLPLGKHVARAAPGPKPNILFIYTDDMGWGDPSCFGNKEISTPNIDRLAAEGMRFAQFYTASPICSPSRVGVTTGMFPARWNVTTYLHARAGNRACEQVDWLDPRAPTMARTFKAAGYATAHFGKWHMGGGRDVQDAPWPKEYGYDEHHVNWEGCGPHIEGFGSATPQLIEDKMLARYEFTGFWADKAMDFIARREGEPFFVELWPQDVHTPHVPDPEELPGVADKPQPHQNFDAVLRRYDKEIGRVLDFLKAKGLEENTIVIFAADNGPEPSFENQRSGGLRGMKWSLYEGGIRTPFLVRWTGKIPAGKVDGETILGGVDLLPTLCALTGVEKIAGFEYDGEDLGAAWLGTPTARKKPLFWEYRRGDAPGFIKPKEAGALSPNLALREGRWKLLVNADGSDAQLYDIAEDIKETKNLAESKAEIAGGMKERLLAWRRGLPALKTGAPNAPVVTSEMKAQAVAGKAKGKGKKK